MNHAVSNIAEFTAEHHDSINTFSWTYFKVLWLDSVHLD